MKKKRIRYSELGTSTPVPAPRVVSSPLPETAADSGSDLADVGTVPLNDAAPPGVVPVPLDDGAPAGLEPVPLKRRVSTPVELARALAAEQHAAEEAEAASNPKVPEVKEELVDLLMFRVGDERFAVELLAVDEVLDLPTIHFVPEMPPAMVGVVDVRGALTPVYSPHLPLGLPLARSEAVLIFRQGTSRVGILIDDVDDAISVDLRELRETPGTHEHDDVVLGVIRYDGALVAVADTNALIAACQTAAVLETA